METQIRVVLRNAGVSSVVPVIVTDEPITYTSSWQDTSTWPANSAADPSTGDSVSVLGSSSETVVEQCDGSCTYRVEGADAIIVQAVCSRELSTHRARRVSSVVVRPDADRCLVAEWVFEQLDPRGRAIVAAREAALRKAEMLRACGLTNAQYERLLALAQLRTRITCGRYVLEVVRYHHARWGQIIVDFALMGHGHVGFTDSLYRRAVDAALAT